MTSRINLPADLTEEDALAVVTELQHRFGWTGTFFTRKDARAFYGRELTDEQWDDLSCSADWAAVEDLLNERGYDMCCDAVDTVLNNSPSVVNF
jgi:hypothetical protein